MIQKKIFYHLIMMRKIKNKPKDSISLIILPKNYLATSGYSIENSCFETVKSIKLTHLSDEDGLCSNIYLRPWLKSWTNDNKIIFGCCFHVSVDTNSEQSCLVSPLCHNRGIFHF